MAGLRTSVTHPSATEPGHLTAAHGQVTKTKRSARGMERRFAEEGELNNPC